MKFGIGAKIVLLLIAVVSLTAAVLGYSLLETSSAIVIEHELVDLGDETNLRARDLQTHLYGIRNGLVRLRRMIPEGTTVDVAVLASKCRSHFLAKFGNSFLRGEIWQHGPTGYERLSVLENDDRPQLADDQENTTSSIADLHGVLAQLQEPEEFAPFLSAIGPIAFKDEPGGSDVYAIWCGIRVPDEAQGRDLYVAALIDLLKPFPGDKNSLVTPIVGSSRHLAILANSPIWTDEFAAEDRQKQCEAVRKGLVYLNHDERAYGDPESDKSPPWLEAFLKLFKERQKRTDDELVQPMLTLDARDVDLLGTVRLDKPFVFLQSNVDRHPELRPPDLRQAFVDRVNELNRSEARRLRGTRIGVISVKTLYFRILADSEQGLQRGVELLDEIALEVSEKENQDIHISWREPVKCRTCNSRYALVPVLSSGLPDGHGYRYYGLAYSAFQEEMEADVTNELSKAWITVLGVVFAVALIGFAASLLVTRPLKRITLAAEAVGKTNVDSANNLWQQEINSIGRMLPVDRGDEIGVLARALRQMIGDLLAGQVRLQHLNADLDRRVTERTDELQRANVELKAARDKADELSRAKDAFLASVSHELRNPLNQVSGFCQLLELTDLDADQRADLKKIKQAGSQLLALINDILDYQKIVMGGITLEPEQLDVAELLGEIRDAMKFPAEENDNDLRVDWSDDIGTIYADKQRLRQVLLNLAGNACKFTHQGSVQIHARRISQNDADDEVVFSVADTGRGMTPEEQAKLFMPFTKLAARQGNRAGTGLGLVISKGFSESMGGNIQVSSEYGKGSTFTVWLPETSPKLASSSSLEMIAALTGSSRAARSALAPEPASPNDSTWRTVEQVRAPVPSQVGQTVLVIDDDVDVREMMTRFLGSQGFDVRTAAGGMEGLELARKERPVAITLDAIMPGLDGWAVLAALKADHETADIPVIMVTMVDNRRRGQIMGADEYIVKPIDWQRLSRVLARFVNNGGKQSLLVVEDDEATRELLRRNLEHDGWSVLEAEHGAEALEILAVKTPAAILLDLMMPVMDGFEFLNRQSADARAIPIIVITAKDPTPEEFQRLNGRAARVLLKGQYTQDELLQEIHRWLDGQLQARTATRGDKQNA